MNMLEYRMHNYRKVESYAAPAGAIGNTMSPFIPGSSPDPNEQYAYHQQMFNKQYQDVAAPSMLPQTGGAVMGEQLLLLETFKSH